MRLKRTMLVLLAGAFVGHFSGATGGAERSAATQAVSVKLESRTIDGLPAEMGNVQKITDIAAAHMSPDGKRLLVSAHKLGLSLFDLEHGKAQRAKALRNDLVGNVFYRHVLFTADGKRIIADGWSESVKENGTIDSVRFLSVWDSEGKHEHTFVDHPDTIKDFVLSPDSQKVMMAYQGGLLREWDLNKHELAREIKNIRTHDGADIQELCYSSDGKFIAGGIDTGHIIVWSADDFKELKRFQPHEGRVKGLQYSADGNSLLSASLRGDIVLSNVATGRDQWRSTVPERVQDATFSPSGKYIGSIGLAQRKVGDPFVTVFRLLRVDDGKSIGATAPWDGELTRALSWNSDGTVLVTTNTAVRLVSLKQ